MNPKDFHFSFPLQLRWNDLDALGHVNNALFATYFEVARGHFMIKACPGWDWHKHMFLIAHLDVQFKKELLLNAENPRVLMRTKHIGNKSFVLEYVVISGPENSPIFHVSGQTTQVMIDLKTRKTCAVQDWVIKSLEQFEGKSLKKD